MPSKGEVIRTRDVTFDEKTFYTLDNIDGALIKQELYYTIQILQEIPKDVLAQNQDLDELEIPAITYINSIPPPTNKELDKAQSTARQPYPLPALTDVNNTQSSTSTPSARGAPTMDIGEQVGE